MSHLHLRTGLQKAERDRYYKSDGCYTRHKNVLGKLIYYEEGDDFHQDAGFILGVSRPVKNKIIAFFGEAVNDIPLSECHYVSIDEVKNAPYVSFDHIEGRWYSKYQTSSWAKNIKRFNKNILYKK